MHLCVGVAFFIFARLIFERFCGDEAAYSGNTGNRLRKWRWLGRPRRARKHAVTWKDFHFTMGGRLSVLFRMVGYVGMVLFWAWAGNDLGSRASLASYAWGWGWVAFYTELAFLALFMWGPEVWGQHIGVLIATPRSLRRLNFEKMKAIMMATMPSVSLVLLAMAIGGSTFINQTVLGSFNAQNWPAEALSWRVWRILSILQWIAQFGVLLSLIVNLSLRLKWTALPAAVGLFALYQIVHILVSIAQFSISGARFSSPALEPAMLMTISLAVIFALAWNTRVLLLHRATEG